MQASSRRLEHKDAGDQHKDVEMRIKVGMTHEDKMKAARGPKRPAEMSAINNSKNAETESRSDGEKTIHVKMFEMNRRLLAHDENEQAWYFRDAMRTSTRHWMFLMTG